MELDLGLVHEIEIKDLQTSLSRSSGEVVLYVPCNSIGNTQNSIDIANDYLFALYVGEVLHPYCSTIKSALHDKGVSFSFQISNASIANEIHNLACLLSDEGYEEYCEVTSDYSERIHNTKIHFPDLADAYMVNMIHDSDYGYVTEDFNDEDLIDHENPEYFFGFWKSFASASLGFDIYVSSWSWIVPRGNDGYLPKNLSIQHLLESFGGYGPNVPSLTNALHVSISGHPELVVNSHVILFFPEDAYRQARQCVNWIYRKAVNQNVYEASDPLEPNYLATKEITLIMASEEGSVLVVTDSVACYIFIQDDNSAVQCQRPVTDMALRAYLGQLESILEHFAEYLGIQVKTECPWDQLNDEQFEELCYHLLSNSERFDPDSVKKLGKSRSRDGGRDFVANTRKQFGQKPAKWIFQCKLLTKAKSLGANRIQVSDLIDQYGAQGYCIITNVSIDATLHDKLDAIAANKRIDVDKWDVYHLERLLASPRNRNIRQRYFGF